MMPFQAMRLRALSGGGASSYDAAVLSDSPAGYWKLDETSGTVAADSSGNGRDGSYVGSPILSSSGVTLDGISQCIKVVSSALDVIGAAAQSYTFEISATALSGVASPSAIMGKTSISSPTDWNLLQYVSGAAHFQLYDGSSNPIAQATSTLGVGTEAIIHAVRDRTTNSLLVYVNGNSLGFAGEPSVGAVDVANTIPLCFGARGDGQDRFCKVKLRRAAVYLSALDASRIAAHAAAA